MFIKEKTLMNFEAYLVQFESILENPNPTAPYTDPEYAEYTKLNWSRMSRWLKIGKISDEFRKELKAISQPQNWIVITEPWCGDAAHLVPFIHLASLENPLITVDYQLRDSEPFLIEKYLTNGSKSIPKLIIKNENGNDLAVWGPRPEKCQAFYNQLVADKVDSSEIKLEIQKWYNADKGTEVQLELGKALVVIENVTA